MVPRVGDQHRRADLLADALRGAEQKLLRHDRSERSDQGDLAQRSRRWVHYLRVRVCAKRAAGQQQQARNGERAERLEAAVAVRMVVVGGQLRHVESDECERVRDEVGEGVARVGHHGCRVADDPSKDLEDREGEVDGGAEPCDARRVSARIRRLLLGRRPLERIPSSQVSPRRRPEEDAVQHDGPHHFATDVAPHSREGLLGGWGNVRNAVRVLVVVVTAMHGDGALLMYKRRESVLRAKHEWHGRREKESRESEHKFNCSPITSGAMTGARRHRHRGGGGIKRHALLDWH
mmetsp:Transcript_2243/g.5057  ORF Transcript_2243/g.5057 Transcript_2243/m.5057 type:complete len:292 (-) Transcript_2243:2-877(-)